MDRERRRLIFPYQTSSFNNEVFKDFQSASLVRTLVCNVAEAPDKCRLLRVLNKAIYLSPKALFRNVNLRYVACQLSRLPSSISLVWNLQTLVFVGSGHLIVAPLEIWRLTQLRHLKVDQISLPDPPPSHDKDDSVVLENLQTLALVTYFRLSAETCKRIPNIRKLCMRCDLPVRCNDSWYDNLQNLGRLQRLESIYLQCSDEFSISKLNNAFPSSLNKLVLESHIPDLEELSMIIGSLPQLEVLKLRGRFSSQFLKWNCVEGGFLRLKFLSIENRALESWTLDGYSCFPVLEKLVLINLYSLNEIPSGIGEIPMLQLIRLEGCRESLVIQAMKIKEEQESFGNYGLQIQHGFCWDKF